MPLQEKDALKCESNFYITPKEKTSYMRYSSKSIETHTGSENILLIMDGSSDISHPRMFSFVKLG